MKRLVLIMTAILLVSILTSSFIFAPAKAADGLVGWWKFDEGSGTSAADSSGNGNTGTLNNGPVWVDGKYGKALKLDGLADYIQVPQSGSLDMIGQVTVEAWIYPLAYVDSTGQSSHIVSRTDWSGGHIYVLGLCPNSHKASYSVNPSPPSHSSIGDIQLNAWTHLAMTYDGSYVRFYTDGQFDSEYALSGAIQITSNWLAIGCKPTASGGGPGTYAYFNGTIDDVRIYNKALTQKEIQTDMGFSRGPKMDNLYIKYYDSVDSLFTGLKNGEVDLTNWDWLYDQTHINEIYNDTELRAAISPNQGMYCFDLNNNLTVPSYPSWTSPTAYKKFRQGIACLVNKNQIVNYICSNSYRLDTPIPRPIYDWWVDWSVSQYDSYGGLLGNYPYEYDPSLAASYFDAAGFVEGNENNTYYVPGFPNSAIFLRKHPETNATMQPLIMYIRDSPTERLQAGRLLRDNLRKMGIPVNAIETNLSTCVQKVMMEGDYHIYTGGWTFITHIEALSIYTSAQTGILMPNYVQFRNATYDESYAKALYAQNFASAREAELECQKILIKEAACIWLFTPSHIMSYRNVTGITNARGETIDNRWTFLKACNYSRATLYYGLLTAPGSLNPGSLNVITDYYGAGYNSVADCLDRIYDTLLSYSPYDKTPDRGGEIMPWMAKDWEVEEWESPYNPAENLTKLTFHLREGIRWHDRIALDSSDVKFTIEYLKALGADASLYSSVYSVHHVVTPDAFTVIVYENVSSIWTLCDIGTLPILPKHIFQTISNVTGYTPGGLPANQTLIGSGPWEYVFHNSTMLYLTANRDYFMETPPMEEIDFRYDWEKGSYIIDTIETAMLLDAYWTSGTLVPSAKWEPGCDVNGDGLVDLDDMMIVNAKFNFTWGASAKRYISPLPTSTSLYVEYNSPVLVGQNLTAYVKLQNLDKLSSIQLQLDYDNTKLTCLSSTVNNTFDNRMSWIDQTRGYVWVQVFIDSPISGNNNLATIVFNATQPGSSTLDLGNTKLSKYGVPGMTCQLMNHNTIDKGVIVGVSTPTGSNITVAPAQNTQVTFAQTTTTGITTVNITQPPSTEFASVLCNDIETTASYSGNVTLRFNYDPTGLSLEAEQAMKIWLWNETSGKWVDITTSVDTDNNIVYGVSPHLSMFGITSDMSLTGDFGSGDTTVRILDTPPSPPPSGLTFLACYDIETRAQYTPPVTMRIAYDSSALRPEEEAFVKIWIWTGSSWVDITTSVNTQENVVYGLAPHLSMFGITHLSSALHDISAWRIPIIKTVVGKGFTVVIDFVVKNEWDFTADLPNIPLYCNSTLLATYSATLGPKVQIALHYEWNTVGFSKGNYTISVFDKPVGWIIVAMQGDIVGSSTGYPDKVVDMKDISTVAKLFGVEYPDSRYNPNCDIIFDTAIDMKDISFVAKRFGQEEP